jgi:hypothetical protein
MNLTADQADIQAMFALRDNQGETPMLRKLTLTLAAAATLGAAALAPNAASAAHWGHWHGWYGFGPYRGPLYSSCVVRQWVRTPWGPRLRWVNICY